jgi:hypothetical protein
MSERGSWCTEYIACDHCFDGLKKHFMAQEQGKYFSAQQLNSSWSGELPILAGKIGGLWGGEEVFVFDQEMRPGIEAAICHPVRIAVLAETGQQMLTFNPRRRA